MKNPPKPPPPQLTNKTQPHRRTRRQHPQPNFFVNYQVAYTPLRRRRRHHCCRPPPHIGQLITGLKIIPPPIPKQQRIIICHVIASPADHYSNSTMSSSQQQQPQPPPSPNPPTAPQPTPSQQHQQQSVHNCTQSPSKRQRVNSVGAENNNSGGNDNNDMGVGGDKYNFDSSEGCDWETSNHHSLKVNLF